LAIVHENRWFWEEEKKYQQIADRVKEIEAAIAEKFK
jgi:hypothetical protein